LIDATGLVTTYRLLGGYSQLDQRWWLYYGEVKLEWSFPTIVVAAKRVPQYDTYFARASTYADFVQRHDLTGGGWW
jgi:hypothetical protein